MAFELLFFLSLENGQKPGWCGNYWWIQWLLPKSKAHFIFIKTCITFSKCI